MVLLTEILPSSSSTHDPSHRYDVFLSFRGVDTRNGFTYHLYNALLDAGFLTFFDDEEIETGAPLKPELETAIQSSRASIIVLSNNYATSTWCLDELLLILDRRRNSNHIVIPIFYHVEPTHVRKQQNSFGDAMALHKQRMETEIDAHKINQLNQKMESWKMALKEVADLKGISVNGRRFIGYLSVHGGGLKTGDTFRFYHTSSTTALSSAAAVSSHLRSFNQGSNDTTGGDKLEVFGGLIFACPDIFGHGQPDINSSPFLDNFPGVTLGGNFCSSVIGRRVLTPYNKESHEQMVVCT